MGTPPNSNSGKPPNGPPTLAPRPQSPNPASANPVARPSPPTIAPAVPPSPPRIAPSIPAVPTRAATGAVPLIPSIAPVVPPSVAPVRPGPPVIAPAPMPRPAQAVRRPSSTVGNLDAEQLVDLEQRCLVLNDLDYFQILKIEKTATPADIKKSFYQQSRTFHPDRFYQVDNPQLKDQINDLYKRITEAYFVLRDDTKRKKYLAEVTGPERTQKLRFTETSEAETKQAVRKEQAEQIGTHPKGRQFFQSGMADYDAQRWSAAERNFKMATTYEPQNALYKEKLADVQQKVHDEFKKSGHAFKIR